MPDVNLFMIVAGSAVAILVLYLIFKSPFKYPYFDYSFDVSGKRSPQVLDYIDNFINEGGFQEIQEHYELIISWKQWCEEKIEKSILKNYRQKQYIKSIDDENAFCFYLTREQTRYRQRNYVKMPYKVTMTVDSFTCHYEYLQERENELAEIGYETTLRNYRSSNQRKLMTQQLRRKIMERDDYTCQSCGKYMPDEVGLHIDHIVPVSKGGKTVESNLQVLCSKCNGSKYNHI